MSQERTSGIRACSLSTFVMIACTTMWMCGCAYRNYEHSYNGDDVQVLSRQHSTSWLLIPISSGREKCILAHGKRYDIPLDSVSAVVISSTACLIVSSDNAMCAYVIPSNGEMISKPIGPLRGDVVYVDGGGRYYVAVGTDGVLAISPEGDVVATDHDLDRYAGPGFRKLDLFRLE